MGSCAAGDCAVPIRCGPGLFRIQVIVARPEEEPDRFQQSRVAVVASQAGSGVAYHDPVASDSPRWVKPDDEVGGLKQFVRPPEIDPLGNPPRMFSDRSHRFQSSLPWPSRPGTTFVSDLVKVDAGRAKAVGNLMGQGGLNTSWSSDDVNAIKPALGRCDDRSRVHGSAATERKGSYACFDRLLRESARSRELVGS